MAVCYTLNHSTLGFRSAVLALIWCATGCCLVFDGERRTSGVSSSWGMASRRGGLEFTLIWNMIGSGGCRCHFESTSLNYHSLCVFSMCYQLSDIDAEISSSGL